MPPSLSDVQTAFRLAVLEEQPDALADMIDPQGLPPLARIAVYRNNILGALSSALQLSYPTVLALVGEAFFDWAAIRYSRLAPPDWAVEQALHAREAPVLGPADLGRLPIDALAALVLRPQPSLALLRLDSPADAIRRAILSNGDALDRIDLGIGPVFLTVVRRDDAIEVRRMEAPVWALLHALVSGQPLGVAAGDFTLAGLGGVLADFLAHGYFTAWELSALDLEGT